MMILPVSKGKYFTIIDKSDYHLIEGKNLSITPNGYITFTFKKKRILLHRLIMDAPDGMVVDHRNHDTKDNRRENLRLCTHAENGKNKRPSGLRKYKGVTKQANGYACLMNIKKKFTHLGTYDTPEEAALAYNRKATELFGEFACLNVIS